MKSIKSKTRLSVIEILLWIMIIVTVVSYVIPEGTPENDKGWSLGNCRGYDSYWVKPNGEHMPMSDRDFMQYCVGE